MSGFSGLRETLSSTGAALVGLRDRTIQRSYLDESIRCGSEL